MLYGPLVSGSYITTPIVLIAAGIVVLFLLWEGVVPALGRRPLLPYRQLPDAMRRADWLGSLLLIVALSLLVVAFAAADPSTQVLASGWPLLLGGCAVAALAFVARERVTEHPLVRFRDLSDRAVTGAVVANLCIGTALMAALVDVPLFTRAATFSNLPAQQAQFQSAIVLLRLLVPIPVGALLGGAICERISYRATTAIGMCFCVAGFLTMTGWQSSTPTDPFLGLSWLHASDLSLGLCGFGFGLAIAPINAAVLAAVGDDVHGLASAVVVMARTIGMLVGLSLLTAIGLHHFYGVLGTSCPDTFGCPNSVIVGAVTAELHVIFLGAAIAAAAAGVIGLVALRRRHGVHAQAALPGYGV